MSDLAVYTCPVLARVPGEPAHAAFADLEREVLQDLAQAGRPGLVRVVSPLATPLRWPVHVAAAGAPKPTLSVWRDLDAAFAYSYGRGPHREALRRRREWFLPLAAPVYVLWYVPTAEAASHDEAVARLELLATAGPTPAAFDFRHPFAADGMVLDPARFAALRGDDGQAERAGRSRPEPLPLRDGTGR